MHPLRDSVRSLLRPALGFPRRAGGQPESDEDRNYRMLVLTGVSLGLSDGIIGNFIGVFLARLGASTGLLSWLTAGPSLVGILAYPPGGFFTERYRDMVRLTVVGSFFLRLSYLIAALLPFLLPRNAVPVAVIIVWSLSMIPTAVHIPAWSAVMQRAVSPRRRPVLNGTRWSLVSIVTGVSVVVVGYILDRTPFPQGYQAVCAFTFVMSLAYVYLFAKVRVPPFEVRVAASMGETLAARLSRQFEPMLQSRLFVRFILAASAYRIAANMPAGLLSIFWVNELHASNTWIGLRGTAGYVALVVGYRFWGRIANRTGHRKIMLLCCSGVGLYPILTALSPSVEWLLLAAVVGGLMAPGMDIGMLDLLLAVSPAGRQPSFAAMNSMVASLCSFVGPLLGAAMVGVFGIRLALILIGVLTIVGSISFLLLPDKAQEEALHADATL